MIAVNIHKTISWTSSEWGSWKNEKDWLLIREILRFSFRLATQIWSNWNFWCVVLNFQKYLTFFRHLSWELDYDRSSDGFTAIFFLTPVVFLHWPFFSFFSRLIRISTNMIYTALKDTVLTRVLYATTPRKPALKSKDIRAAKVLTMKKNLISLWTQPCSNFQ